MKFKNKITVTIFLFMLMHQVSIGQLYSSGNNSISGDNVGVANTVPSALLHVSQKGTKATGPLNQDIFLIESTRRIIGYTANDEPIYGDSKPYFLVDKKGFVGIDTELPEYHFHLNGNGYVSNKFYVDEKLGIGTTSPTENLEVKNGNILISDGELIITGTNNASAGNTEIKLQSNGYIRAREIKVDLQTIPDYVFSENYELMPLEELKQFIETNKHLPNVKSEAAFEAEGSISLTEMNLKLLEKVEELTLYILDLQGQIDELKIK